MEELGTAMINLVLKGNEKKVLAGKDLINVSQFDGI
jgi:hypothetical protein